MLSTKVNAAVDPCNRATVFTICLRIPARRLPISERELSISARRLPISERELSISERRLPISERKLPISARRLPISERELLISARRLPISERELPISARVLLRLAFVLSNEKETPSPCLCKTSLVTLLVQTLYPDCAYFNGSEANILRYPRSCNQVRSVSPTRFSRFCQNDHWSLCKKTGKVGRNGKPVSQKTLVCREPYGSPLFFGLRGLSFER
jgi:hypothetical protein